MRGGRIMSPTRQVSPVMVCPTYSRRWLATTDQPSRFEKPRVADCRRTILPSKYAPTEERNCYQKARAWGVLHTSSKSKVRVPICIHRYNASIAPATLTSCSPMIGSRRKLGVHLPQKASTLYK